MKRFNEGGFALVFVIIITGILLVLGLSASVLTHNDYKMKKLNSKSKKNFYIAEAASEEAEIKLHEYIEDSLKYSYKNLPKYNNSQIDEHFIHLYKEQLKALKITLEDVDLYNLKKDNYKFSIDILLVETKDSGFTLDIISTCEEENILERIKVSYHIKLPEYKNLTYNENLITRKKWVNYKW